MQQVIFNYQLNEDTVVFTDTLEKNAPYISMKPRDHESIFFVTNGTLLYEKEGNEVVVEKGQVGYIGRGSIDKSSAYQCEKVSYIAINFLFDKDSIAPTLPFETLCSHGFPYDYESLFDNALNNFINKTPGYITICNGIVMQIIGLLYNEHQTDYSDFKKSQRIHASVEYLKSNYHNQNLKISHLAEISGLGEKQFRRLFTDVYKKTPYHFLLDFRIEKAKILLSNTQKSISEIAIQCGFADVYSFSHSFKTRTGFAPKVYKQR